jgi:hypothetical protein
MTVGDILSKYDEAIATLALELRNFLLTRLKDISEIPDSAAGIIGYGYGPGYKDLICTILLSKKGVKLGFYKGAELPDPKKLLTGTGKVHRYVEIRTAAVIKDPAVGNLLKEALTAYRKRKQ